MKRAFVWILLSLAAGGCATTAASLTRRFSRESGCPESQVVVHEAGGERYEATGCGQNASYVCGHVASFSNAGAECERSGMRSPTVPNPATPAAPPYDPRYATPPAQR